MAKKDNYSNVPSQVRVPGQMKFDHEVPYIGKTTALPLGSLNAAPALIPKPMPNQFMFESTTKGKQSSEKK